MLFCNELNDSTCLDDYDDDDNDEKKEDSLCLSIIKDLLRTNKETDETSLALELIRRAYQVR